MRDIKIENKHVYTVYDRYENKAYNTNNINSLYEFIYKKVKKDFRSIDFSGSDTDIIRKGYYNPKTDICYYTKHIYAKQYIIYDNGVIFDIRNHTEEYSKYIENREIAEMKWKPVLLNKVSTGDKCISTSGRVVYHSSKGIVYRFRQDPVPFIHNHSKYRNCFRVPPIRRHLRVWAIEEYREYTRKPNIIKGRISLWWDDFNYRGSRSSWKNNKKIRYQWQKNDKKSKELKGIINIKSKRSLKQMQLAEEIESN